LEYAADDINYGYRSIMMLINSEKTLIDKLDNLKEIDGLKEHPLFSTNKGGVSFSVVMKNMQTVVEIVLNYGDRFDIHTMTELGSATILDETVETLVNFLNIFYVNLVDDENKLLNSALNKNTYRKTAKTMHYREMFGDDAAL
tara:strand:+ start:5058 stop:5486 length:429 start_codon:yes stop_codon:yes gene_type:complete